MKIYTKTGDTGTTGVIGGRLKKDHPRVEAYGTVDELNSWVGMAVAYLENELYADMIKDLGKIQHHLFDCGADLATVDSKLREYHIRAEYIDEIERRIDHYEQETEDIDLLIIPGGCQASAVLHVCRTVCRRAERRVVALFRQETQSNEEIRRYLNRLSDLLFVMARVCNTRTDVPDVHYIRSKKVTKVS